MTKITENSQKLSTEDIKDVLSKGYFVDVRFGQPKTAVTVNPKRLGLNQANNEHVQGFMDAFIENNRVSFVGKNNELIRKTTNISKATHGRKKVMALGSSDYFMTDKILAKFKEYVSEKEKEYFELRDQLVVEYPGLVARFERKLRRDFLENSFGDKDPEELDRFVKSVMSKIPSKQEFYDAFHVTLKRTRILLPDEVSADEEDEVMSELFNQVNEITGKTMNIVFSGMNNLLSSYEKTGEIRRGYKAFLVNLAQEVEDRNIFGVEFLSIVKKRLTEMREMPASELIEASEYLACMIYAKSAEIKVEGELDLRDSDLEIEYMISVGEMELNMI